MTIHTSLQLQQRPDVHLGAAVRNAIAFDGVVALLDRLGFECFPRRSEPSTAADALNISLACHLGDRGTLRIVFAEVTTSISPSAILDVCSSFRNADPVRPLLTVIAAASYRTLTFACFAPGGELRHLTFEPLSPLPADLDVLQDMVAAPDEPGVSLALRIAAALDAGAVSARFFAEVRSQRDRISQAWVNIPEAQKAERDQLALLLLCRLIFLYFLQRQGHLAGDPAYIRQRVRVWQNEPSGNSLYRAMLTPLFFAVLNTRPEQRSAEALGLGPLPYLNGGLFERTTSERRFSELDLPDYVTGGIFDALLDRFRFTAVDAADAIAGVAGVHIDPEMLGRVFEGLMGADRRSETGTFYTPPQMVDLLTTRTLATYLADDRTSFSSALRLLTHGEVVGFTYAQRETISARLREVRVLDPACGSGAFLLGALSRISSARVVLGEEPVPVRRDVVARCLHGLDLLDDAALLCSLRLWLALADTGDVVPPPLPNLDRSVRQGDALLDPLELVTPRSGSDADGRAMRDRDVRAALTALRPLAERYIDAEPEERLVLRAAIAHAEVRLAMAWVVALNKRLQQEARDAVARSRSVDLWGETTNDARTAQKSAVQLKRRCLDARALIDRMSSSATLPFFSFRVHFAEQPQFNIILSNPPWIRAHRWPAVVGGAIRERYEVCRAAGWPGAALHGSRAGGQVDLAVLFLERSLSLLRPGGALGMLLPAKFLRSLYAGGARSLLQRVAQVISIDDYSLDQRAVFRADAFTVALVAKKGDAAYTATGGSADPAPHRVRVRMSRRSVEPLEFELEASDLTVIPFDDAAPWMLAPPEITRVLRKMQVAGSGIAQQQHLSIGRGVVTGANDVLVFREYTHKLGGLTHVRAEGYFRARKLSQSTAASRKFVAYVETDALRPLLRGTDVRAWCAAPSCRVVWTEKGGVTRRKPRPRMDSYLARHGDALRNRTGVPAAAAPGSLMRLSHATTGNKVVWRDIAQTLCAAAIPDTVRGDGGQPVPVIPLNTTYFVSVPDHDTALLLSAYMNSLPLRVFARTCAERAKDAHFRFFAWTVGILPLPSDWMTRCAADLRNLARCAHDAHGMSKAAQARLDVIVASVFGLDDADVSALVAFDGWLSGES